MNWQPKNPERITFEQFQEYIAKVHKHGCCTNVYRIAFRDFWLSRESKTLKPFEVSGLMTSGTEHILGKWKDVYVSKDILEKIFAYIKERNFLAYAADFRSFKTGCRKTAILTQFLHSKLRTQAGQHLIKVTDKGFHRNGRQTFDKVITDDLLAVLNQCWEVNGENPFKGLDKQLLNNLNKEAYRLFLVGTCFDVDEDNVPGSNSVVSLVPALDLGLSKPFHFLRHCFGAHMLRATHWNYTAVAYLGSWKDEKMLHMVYGAPPMQMLLDVGLKFIPQI